MSYQTSLIHRPAQGRTALVERRLLPAGQAYLAHVRRAVHNLSFEEHDKHAEEERKRYEALHGTGNGAEDDLGVGDEEEPEDLLTLDPKEWKVRPKHLKCLTDTQYLLLQKQDHYAVLGLSHLRYKATPEQIKIAREFYSFTSNGRGKQYPEPVELLDGQSRFREREPCKLKLLPPVNLSHAAAVSSRPSLDGVSVPRAPLPESVKLITAACRTSGSIVSRAEYSETCA